MIITYKSQELITKSKKSAFQITSNHTKQANIIVSKLTILCVYSETFYECF